MKKKLCDCFIWIGLILVFVSFLCSVLLAALNQVLQQAEVWSDIGMAVQCIGELMIIIGLLASMRRNDHGNKLESKPRQP